MGMGNISGLGDRVWADVGSDSVDASFVVPSGVAGG